MFLLSNAIVVNQFIIYVTLSKFNKKHAKFLSTKMYYENCSRYFIIMMG